MSRGGFISACAVFGFTVVVTALIVAAAAAIAQGGWLVALGASIYAVLATTLFVFMWASLS